MPDHRTQAKPKLIVIAGPNGSGKTTITRAFLQTKWLAGCEYVNPDEIALDLYNQSPHYKPDDNYLNIPRDIYIKALNLAGDLREQYLEEHRDIAFETVMSGVDKVDFILRAKEIGYFVRLFFVCTRDPGINAARVLQRVSEGGHTVKIEKILQRYIDSLANCMYLTPYVDRLYVYDNTLDGEDAKLVFRAVEGRFEKAYLETPGWAQPILDLLDPLE